MYMYIYVYVYIYYIYRRKIVTQNENQYITARKCTYNTNREFL